MQWGNCWFYALPKWLKNPRQTYLIIRLTREPSWIPILHVMFAESIKNTEVSEFKPSQWTKKKVIYGPLGLLFRRIPLYSLFFHGRTRTGLGEEGRSREVEAPNQQKGNAMKPGWKTTEFWATLGMVVGTQFSPVAEAAGPKTAMTLQAVMAAMYVLSRGVAKMNQPNE